MVIMKQVYIINKLVVASSIADALKKEKDSPVNDVMLDPRCKSDLADSLYSHAKKQSSPGFSQGKKGSGKKAHS